jgi:hypothetical protein
MATLTVPNRPFASDRITGLMLPDGIFEATLGKQILNAHFTNTSASPITDAAIYVEGASHPGVVVTPYTYQLNNFAGNKSLVLSWEIDVSAVPAGTYFISFIVETASDRQRIIKKIFVTRILFDPTTKTFTAQTPEGVMKVGLADLVTSRKHVCCRGKVDRSRQNNQFSQNNPNPLKSIFDLFRDHELDFEFCLPGYLPHNVEVGVTSTPPFSGQYSDLPFQDPWWKIVLAVIAAILLIAAAIAEAVGGTGSIEPTGGAGGTFDETSGDVDCCNVGVEASGGGTSYVAAGLVAAAAAVATVAAASDSRDPFRRGQDNTMPAPGELTISETMRASLLYSEPIALGKPFTIGLNWKYTRVTTGNTYSYSANDTNKNVHVLSRYKISAPEVVRPSKEELFIVRAEFFDSEGQQLKGSDLFVQCFLVGPYGRYLKFQLQDFGLSADGEPSDGIYTGYHYFFSYDDVGLWRYFVIAQDVNNAQPDLTPEEAAQIIGGMVVTHQLTISFEQDTCPFVPDGYVNVI